MVDVFAHRREVLFFVCVHMHNIYGFFLHLFSLSNCDDCVCVTLECLVLIVGSFALHWCLCCEHFD